MIEYVQAEKLFFEFLEQLGLQGNDIVILKDQTIERSWGWVFFYQSKNFLETGQVRYALAGNAPVAVRRSDGSLHVTGTAFSIESYLNEYDREWGS